MTPDEIRRRASEIKWFHTIDLGHGITTPGVGNTPKQLGMIGLPPDLGGKTVLDIGAWDGFFSFEAERRGAARILAVDSFCWSGAGWGTKAGFSFAREVLGSRVEDLEIEVLDLAPERVGAFDIVLFLGVLYHMRHPLLALERVSSVTRELLILETAVDFVDKRRPVVAFYPGAELNRDPTNWWVPNPAALLSMLRTVGFREIRIVRKPRGLPYRMSRAVGRCLRHGKNAFTQYQRDRIVVHALK